MDSSQPDQRSIIDSLRNNAVLQKKEDQRRISVSSSIRVSHQYEQVSKKDILTRYREKRPPKPQPIVSVNLTDAPEPIKPFDYVVEVPKSGQLTRDEFLAPLFLPTKCEVENMENNSEKSHSESKTASPPPSARQSLITFPPVRQLIYCSDPVEFQHYKDLNKPKAHWGLRFDSNFECGNLYKVESIITKGATFGTPEEYNLYLQSDSSRRISVDSDDNSCNRNDGNYKQHCASHSSATDRNGSSQWFFFNIRNTKRRVYKFNICNLHHIVAEMYRKGMRPVMIGEQDYKASTKGWSRVGENITCTHNNTAADSSNTNGGTKHDTYTLSFTLAMDYSKDSVYIAYNPPYTYTQLQNMLYMMFHNPVYKNHLEISTLCRTSAGNKCDMLMITQNRETYKQKPPSGDGKNDPDIAAAELRATLQLANLTASFSADGKDSNSSKNNRQSASRSTAASFSVSESAATASDVTGSVDVDRSADQQTSSLSSAEGAAAAAAATAKTETTELKSKEAQDAAAGEARVLYKIQQRLEREVQAIELKRRRKNMKQVVCVTARSRPSDTVSSWMCEGLIKFLLGNTSTAVSLRKHFVFYIIPMLNPDGLINGNSRCDLNNCDLAKQWSRPSEALHPTIYHTKQLMKRLQIERENVVSFIDLHGHCEKDGMFFRSLLPQFKSPEDVEDEENDTQYTGLEAIRRRESKLKADKERDPRTFFFAAAKRSNLITLRDCSLTVSARNHTSSRSVMSNEVHIPLSVMVFASNYRGPNSPRDHVQNLQHLLPADYARFGCSICQALSDMFETRVAPRDSAVDSDGRPISSGVLTHNQTNPGIDSFHQQDIIAIVRELAVTSIATDTPFEATTIEYHQEKARQQKQRRTQALLRSSMSFSSKPGSVGGLELAASIGAMNSSFLPEVSSFTIGSSDRLREGGVEATGEAPTSTTAPTNDVASGEMKSTTQDSLHVVPAVPSPSNSSGFRAKSASLTPLIIRESDYIYSDTEIVTLGDVAAHGHSSPTARQQAHSTAGGASIVSASDRDREVANFNEALWERVSVSSQDDLDGGDGGDGRDGREEEERQNLENDGDVMTHGESEKTVPDVAESGFIGNKSDLSSPTRLNPLLLGAIDSPVSTPPAVKAPLSTAVSEELTIAEVKAAMAEAARVAEEKARANIPRILEQVPSTAHFKTRAIRANLSITPRVYGLPSTVVAAVAALEGTSPEQLLSVTAQGGCEMPLNHFLSDDVYTGNTISNQRPHTTGTHPHNQHNPNQHTAFEFNDSEYDVATLSGVRTDSRGGGGGGGGVANGVIKVQFSRRGVNNGLRGKSLGGSKGDVSFTIGSPEKQLTPAQQALAGRQMTVPRAMFGEITEPYTPHRAGTAERRNVSRENPLQSPYIRPKTSTNTDYAFYRQLSSRNKGIYNTDPSLSPSKTRPIRGNVASDNNDDEEEKDETGFTLEEIAVSKPLTPRVRTPKSPRYNHTSILYDLGPRSWKSAHPFGTEDCDGDDDDDPESHLYYNDSSHENTRANSRGDGDGGANIDGDQSPFAEILTAAGEEANHSLTLSPDTSKMLSAPTSLTLTVNLPYITGMRSSGEAYASTSLNSSRQQQSRSRPPVYSLDDPQSYVSEEDSVEYTRNLINNSLSTTRDTASAGLPPTATDSATKAMQAAFLHEMGLDYDYIFKPTTPAAVPAAMIDAAKVGSQHQFNQQQQTQQQQTLSLSLEGSLGSLGQHASHISHTSHVSHVSKSSEPTSMLANLNHIGELNRGFPLRKVLFDDTLTLTSTDSFVSGGVKGVGTITPFESIDSVVKHKLHAYYHHVEQSLADTRLVEPELTGITAERIFNIVNTVRVSQEEHFRAQRLAHTLKKTKDREQRQAAIDRIRNVYGNHITREEGTPEAIRKPKTLAFDSTKTITDTTAVGMSQTMPGIPEITPPSRSSVLERFHKVIFSGTRGQRSQKSSDKASNAHAHAHALRSPNNMAKVASSITTLEEQQSDLFEGTMDEWNWLTVQESAANNAKITSAEAKAVETAQAIELTSDAAVRDVDLRLDSPHHVAGSFPSADFIDLTQMVTPVVNTKKGPVAPTPPVPVNTAVTTPAIAAVLSAPDMHAPTSLSQPQQQQKQQTSKPVVPTLALPRVVTFHDSGSVTTEDCHHINTGGVTGRSAHLASNDVSVSSSVVRDAHLQQLESLIQASAHKSVYNKPAASEVTTVTPSNFQQKSNSSDCRAESPTRLLSSPRPAHVDVFSDRKRAIPARITGSGFHQVQLPSSSRKRGSRPSPRKIMQYSIIPTYKPQKQTQLQSQTPPETAALTAEDRPVVTIPRDTVMTPTTLTAETPPPVHNSDVPFSAVPMAAAGDLIRQFTPATAARTAHPVLSPHLFSSSATNNNNDNNNDELSEIRASAAVAAVLSRSRNPSQNPSRITSPSSSNKKNNLRSPKARGHGRFSFTDDVDSDEDDEGNDNDTNKDNKGAIVRWITAVKTTTKNTTGGVGGRKNVGVVTEVRSPESTTTLTPQRPKDKLKPSKSCAGGGVFNRQNKAVN